MSKCFHFIGLALGVLSVGHLPMGARAQGSASVLYTVLVPAGEFGSVNFTRQLVSSLASAKVFCGGIDKSAYRVDCLAERLQVVSDTIPEGSDYDEVRQVLNETSADLARLARTNRDTSLPSAPASRRTDSADRTTRALTPVSSAAQAEVGRQAIAILEEAQTQLLRSAEGSNSRSIQYAQISQAIDSTKVLLRS